MTEGHNLWRRSGGVFTKYLLGLSGHLLSLIPIRIGFRLKVAEHYHPKLVLNKNHPYHLFPIFAECKVQGVAAVHAILVKIILIKVQGRDVCF